ncbi:cold-shock protein [Algoriphagus sediminis]|uniref:Cold shock domain-containing protein n=1 Tax=Algoriphagus sediminis TaxID=3057113 RepID=A0ABT7YAD6_9BACT|nr:cold shock domain-containing protein [Algoriphagus sediminis]MDN3203458.1 cold shock domain-containing protein [Algoriphagus sediminis]
MGRSQETFNKKEREKKRQKKAKEKMERREERKDQAVKGTLDNMMAYVDEFGNITDTPPDPEKKPKKIKAENIEIGIPKREEEEEVVRTGKIDFFNTSKGFGFIIESGTGDKYFFHVNGLIDAVDEGDKVTYDLEKGMKGMNAVNVKLVE